MHGSAYRPPLLRLPPHLKIVTTLPWPKILQTALSCSSRTCVCSVV